MSIDKLKDELQEKWSDIFIKAGTAGLVHVAPRAGKTRFALKVCEKIGAKKILVVYPDNKIKNSWFEDVEATDFQQDITYTTYLSLFKHIKEYDIVILDELHASSDAQREEIKKLLKLNRRWIGMSGSLSKDTIQALNQYFKAKIIIDYPIEEAISDGIISNYEIHVVTCKLDDKILTANKTGKMLSEKKKCDNYTWVIDNLRKQGKPTFILALARMRLIQQSIAKINKTKQLLEQFKDDRVLIFSGLTKTANSFGTSVHHSKNENEDKFVEFAAGLSKFNHLAVVKIGNSGVTFKNLDKVILNYFDSNDESTAQKICRCLLLEDDPTKISHIYIITTNEEFELNWLKRSLKMFKQSKITYE